MARSDWPLEKRVVLAGDERFLDLKKLMALFRVRGERDPRGLSDPYEPLIEKYASELFDRGALPGDDPDGRGRWFEELRDLADSEIETRGVATLAARRATGEQLEQLPEETQLWGIAGGV